MCSVDSVECISSPLVVFDKIFCNGGDNSAFLAEVQMAVQQYSSKVPFFSNTSLELISDGHLVRFVGMIQDMFNSELYIDSCRLSPDDATVRSFRYRDHSKVQISEDTSPIDVKFSERQSFYIVPVPGESPWVRKIRVDGNEYMPSLMPSGQKRHLCEPIDAVNKKPRGIATGNYPNQAKFHKHFPLEEEEYNDDKIGALLRVYNEVQSSLKINDIVEVYGILEFARLSDVLPEDSCESTQKCGEPLSRIHAVIVNQLKHNNPLVYDTSTIVTMCSINNYADNIQLVRTKLIQLLTNLFDGDKIVAEYVLLHLVSTRLDTDSRYPSYLPALNIHSSNSMVTTESSSSHEMINSFETSRQKLFNLYKRLCEFLPKVITNLATVELTVKSLNDGPCLIPIRDMNKGHLNAGRLQLPRGTEILVNETAMDSGQLHTKGIINFQALQSVAINQYLTYDFQFYTQQWDTDVRVIILSIVPSLVKCVMLLPWGLNTLEDDDHNNKSQPLNNNTGNADDDVSESDWNEMRRFLTILGCSNQRYSIDSEIQERINQDFVQWRKEKSTYIEADEFAIMLCLLRFHCLTCGYQSPSLQHWQHIVQLESERRRRVALSKWKSSSQRM
ncbi:unnamed protein product [Heterobilharzia americana]|nr:unnamed protein product [Heterobilharzia americana]